jgi:hypothetical protein
MARRQFSSIAASTARAAERRAQQGPTGQLDILTIAMPDQNATQQDLQDELTAYLDGELDAENVRRVEERLARDAAYRGELNQLERAWNMLDRLPRASVDENFTKSTIEMVALSASQEAEAIVRDLPKRRRRQRIIAAISMGAALLVGFAIGTQLWPNPNEQLLDDLPVLENLDLYYQADEIEFLRLLGEKGSFNDADADDTGDDTLALPSAVAAGPATTAEELAARRERIDRMEPSQQQDLLRRYERFQAMPAEEQQRLRKLQAEISDDPLAERLHQVLERYHEWLKTITPSQRATLTELPADERVKEIERMQRRQEDAQRLEPLSRQDMREIRLWIDQLVEKHRKELVAGIPERFRKWFDQEKDPQRKQMALVYRMFGRSRDGARESHVTQDDIDRLADKLSESARAEIEKADSLEDQGKVVRGWIFASLRRYDSWQGGRRANPVVGEELLQFLQNDVSPAERERLLKLPRDDMHRELRKMYFEHGRREGRFGPSGPRRDRRSDSSGASGRSRDARDSEDRPKTGPRPGKTVPADNAPSSDSPRP